LHTRACMCTQSEGSLSVFPVRVTHVGPLADSMCPCLTGSRFSRTVAAWGTKQPCGGECKDSQAMNIPARLGCHSCYNIIVYVCACALLSMNTIHRLGYQRVSVSTPFLARLQTARNMCNTIATMCDQVTVMRGEDKIKMTLMRRPTQATKPHSPCSQRCNH